MAGLLDFLMQGQQGQPGGGLLGGFGNGMNGVSNAFGGNDAMIAMGLGLAGGSTPGEGFKNMIPGFMFGANQRRQQSAADEFGKAFGGMMPGQQAPGAPPMSPPGGGVMAPQQPRMPSYGAPSPTVMDMGGLARPDAQGAYGNDAVMMPSPAPLSYNAKLTSVESGGDPNAKNPNSTATGPAQFTESTWLDNFNKTFPAQESRDRYASSQHLHAGQ